jgi:hypothetical protein
MSDSEIISGNEPPFVSLCDGGMHWLVDPTRTSTCPYCALEERQDRVVNAAKHMRLAFNADVDKRVSPSITTAVHVLSSLLDELDWDEQDAAEEVNATLQQGVLE